MLRLASAGATVQRAADASGHSQAFVFPRSHPEPRKGVVHR